MTADDLAKKIANIRNRTATIAALALHELKDIIDNPSVSDKDKIIYKLEYRYRVKGGETPYQIIVDKLGTTHQFAIQIGHNISLQKY